MTGSTFSRSSRPSLAAGIARFGFLLAAMLAACLSVPSLLADVPRVLPPGQTPKDRRLEPLKDLNGYFPLTPAASAKEWEQRAERVRRGMLVSLGLWPTPAETPLNPVIHGRIERDDYTVEKAYFESFPGFYVTGNLYRPKGKTGKLPGVLCPHGHWANGRFHDAGADAVRREIVIGAERFEEGGRSPLQARSVQLARMGCVVFHYDMIGYADSVQISFDVAHRFAKQRPEMNTAENWGLFSPQAEANCQSVMGLQTYNSIRALDFLCQLPDVDPDRLGVTGASGGGTQTFILSALDPRVTVSFPAVMVSTAMQGGCTCENACGLRIDTGNVEFAALFAPKPIALSAADDWTREMETKGFPELKKHYQMLGAADKAMLISRLDFKHNYNHVCRAAMYQWFNRHLQLGHGEPILERDYKRLTKEEMTVWGGQHPQPEGGPDFERKLLRHWTEDTEKQLAALTPKDEESLGRYREVVGGALDVVIGRGLPAAEDMEYEQTDKMDRGAYLQMMGLLRNKRHGEELPILFLHPAAWQGQVVVWLHEKGKAGLLEAGGEPKPPVRRLIDGGATVVGVDLLYQGEFLADGKPLEKTRRVENPREAACYTFGYNQTVFAQRVHDILSVITFIQNHELSPKRIELVGLEGAGPWAAAARAQARQAIAKAAIDTGGFRFGNVPDIHDPSFLPGGAKYGDLPGMLAVAAPGRLWLSGEGEKGPAIVGAAYAAAGSVDGLVAFSGPAEKQIDAAVSWLLARAD